jgi:acylaminoacyl-peptidase
MKQMYRAALAAALLCSANSGFGRPFTAKDLASLDRVSSPAISPDGRFVAYAVRSTDWDGNKGVNALNVIDLQGDTANPRVLLAGEKGGANPKWSADGRWLYFISGKSGSPQVWRANPDGSVRQQLTSFPVDVAGFKLAPDLRTLVVAADVYPDCPTLACTKDRDDAKAKTKGSGIQIKRGPSRVWDSYEDEKYGGLFRVDLTQQGAPSEAVPILKNFGRDVPADDDINNVALSKDGRTVYFVSADPVVDDDSKAFSKLYAVPTDGSARPRVVAGNDGTAISTPAISPDGSQLAYLAVTQPLGTFGRTALMLMDLKSGRTREIAGGFDATLVRLDWTADGRTLLAAGGERGQQPLFRIEPTTGKVDHLTSDGTVSDFASARGATVYVRDDLGSPQQLFVQQGAGPGRQLTRTGAATLAETPMSSFEQFNFAGWNGETVYGYVMKPAGFVEGRKYPVAFLIHGGPHGSFGNAWSYRWNPQVWAGMGYAVVFVDFHGSSGYGENFGRSIINHWGDRPLEDLQKGWAAALSRYSYLDGNRACALGGSYGGYMVDWIAGQWQQPWKCLVSHAGVFDVRSQGQAMDSTVFINAELGTSSEDLERFNPAVYAGRWKVPILIIHGGKDFRVPTEQGISAYSFARRAGIPSELVVFPDENHWVLKPQNSVQWYQVVRDWMDRWTSSTPVPAMTAVTK